MATKSTIVLGEDETHWLFVYRWLLRRGVHAGEIRAVPWPAGKGAGAAHVVSQYPGEVADYRRKAGHVSARRLIVVIDADAETTAKRFHQLAGALKTAGLDARAEDERIAILVPRRNIETWFYFLRSNTVSEIDDYTHHFTKDTRAKDCDDAADCFVSVLAAPHSAEPPSLTTARTEAARI